MLYPIIFLTGMAKIFSSRLLYAVVLVLYSVPQSFLDWLLWKLTIGIYDWLLWIFGAFVQLCFVGFSPFWHLWIPLWYFVLLVGGILFDPTVCSPSGFSSRRRPPPVLWTLPCSVEIFNGTYSLCGWISPFLHKFYACAGSFASFSSFARDWMDYVSDGVEILISRSCGSLPCGWVSKILFILVYISMRGYFFFRSIFCIFVFCVGVLRHLGGNPIPGVFHTNLDTVSVLTADQLAHHTHCSDFLPGQETAIMDNCTNTHV